MKNSLKKLLIAGLSLFALFLVGSNLPSLQPQYDVALGATIPIPIANFSTSLTNSITSSDTTMTLVSITTEAGTTLTNGAVYGFVIDEGTSIQETVTGTVNTSNNTVTSLSRGISPITGNTEITALKKAHRRGASVKITDHPVLPVIARILNGNETIPNALSYATGVGPSGNSDLTDKEYVLSVVNGGTVSYDRTIIAGNAGETVAIGNLLYLKASDSEWYKTDADTAATVDNVSLGIAQGSGTDGNAISGGILTAGIDSNQSGLSAGNTYYASNTAGALSTSAGTTEVTIGLAKSASDLYFFPRFNQKITENEQDAIAGGGDYGTPSSSNKFLTFNFLSSATGLPVVRKYDTESTAVGSTDTQFDITNPAGSTFRYTWDSTGTDPTINCTANPIGSLVNMQGQNFTSGNKGVFTLTGCGSNYVEVSNASGVAENNVTIGTGYVVESGSTGWTKPANLKYITVRLVGGGAGGQNATNEGGCGGSGGGYSEEYIPASSLSSTEYYIVGGGGATGTGAAGRITNFGTKLQATGGVGPCNPGGIGSGGDINLQGGSASYPGSGATGSGSNNGVGSSVGGSSMMGGGGGGVQTDTAGQDGGLYGGGGGGAAGTSTGNNNGGAGAKGAIFLIEHFQ